MTAQAATICLEHSGTCQSIESLKDFQHRQEDPGGVNERLFNKLDEIARKQSKISGAWTAICFAAGIAATLFCGYLVKHF